MGRAKTEELEEIRRAKIGASSLGRKHIKTKAEGFIGKQHTQETKLKISSTLKEGYASGRIVFSRHNLGKQHTEEHREKIRGTMLGRWANSKYYQRLCEINKAYWQSSEGKACRRRLLHTKPNQSEQFLISFFKEYNLPFKYVGDGQVIIGRLCPDFINTNGRKQLIEFFSDYWHDIFDIARKTERFKEYGFSLLVIWGDELDNQERLLKKVKTFIRRK